tara:strand:+ start:238 stop:468 length:231 start_codon:yes stop_codon:yes gene_type:complete
MEEKGFDTEITLNKTPEFKVSEEKPLINNINRAKKVDINILKDRLQQIQNREQKKNISIFISFLLIIGILGIFLSV